MNHRRNLFALCVLFAAVSLPSLSQVAPSATGETSGRGYVFGEFTAGRPDYGTDFLFGPTVGGYFRLSHLLAVEARGAILRWGPSRYHQETALFGPMVQIPVKRIVPYVAFDAGVGHATYPVVPGLPTLTGSTGFAWQFVGGVDYQMNRRYSLRLGEFTYGSIGVLNGLSPESFSAGVVVRLF